jgi:GNAT superfamily N-acetyltransferase
VTVRAATPDDVDELVRLAGELFRSMDVDLSDTRWAEHARATLGARLGHDDVGAFVVDHPSVPGRLVAGAAGAMSTRLPTPMNPTARAGYIQWVCTDAEHRRAGHGRAVVTALLEWFVRQGVRSVELHSTPVAEPLYLSMGFTDEGPRALRWRAPPP